MSFYDKSEAIIENLEGRSREIKEVSQQIKRARKALQKKKRGVRPPSQPVTKKIYQGTRGGLYYINKTNRRVYLNSGQCKRCVNGNYPVFNDKTGNRVLGCPPKKQPKCPSSRKDLKREIKRLKKKIKDDC